MGQILLITSIYILFIIFELIPKLKSKQYKEFIAYTIIMGIAYIIQMVSYAGLFAIDIHEAVKDILDYIWM